VPHTVALDAHKISAKVDSMNADEAIAEWKSAVGDRVAMRRASRFRSARSAAEAAGISEAIWRQVESGSRTVAAGVRVAANPGLSVKVAICTALGWTPDSIDRLLNGEEPTELPETSSDASFSVDEKLAKLTPAKRAAVIAMLDAMLLDE
jgi:hypothetical protein